MPALQRQHIDSVSTKCQVTMVTGDATCLGKRLMERGNNNPDKTSIMAGSSAVFPRELIRFYSRKSRNAAGYPVWFQCGSRAKNLATTTDHVGALSTQHYVTALYEAMTKSNKLTHRGRFKASPIFSFIYLFISLFLCPAAFLGWTDTLTLVHKVA